MNHCQGLAVEVSEFIVGVVYSCLVDFHDDDLRPVEEYDLVLLRIRRVLLSVQAEALEAIVILNRDDEHDATLFVGILDVASRKVERQRRAIFLNLGEAERHSEAFESYRVALQIELLCHRFTLEVDVLSRD